MKIKFFYVINSSISFFEIWSKNKLPALVPKFDIKFNHENLRFLRLKSDLIVDHCTLKSNISSPFFFLNKITISRSHDKKKYNLRILFYQFRKS